MPLLREQPVPTTLSTLKPKPNSTFTHALLLLLLLLTEAPPPVTAQIPNALPPPPPDRVPTLKFDKSMAIVLVILVVVFFVLGFLSVYTRQCTDRRLRGRFDLSIPVMGGGSRRQRGLDPEVINTFPTFVYSTVKGRKIGGTTLECAVCLNEFQDDETLRLIPKCSHVFHPECIDAWLSNHSTCPVCRADLFPRPGDPDFVSIQILDPDPNGSNRSDSEGQDINSNEAATVESPKVNDWVNQNRPPRSKSTGFRLGNLFPRSHSTGHSLVQPSENYDRFTLRLPEDVRNQLMLTRTTSSGVKFTPESSVRRSYRTRSVGSSLGRNYLQYERFDRPDRRGLSRTPPFFNRSGSMRSLKGSMAMQSNKSPVGKDDVGERSSDRLYTVTGSEN